MAKEQKQESTVLTEEQRQRALSRYTNMRARRDVQLPAFRPMGSLVNASNPDELDAEGTKALVEESEKVSS